MKKVGGMILTMEPFFRRVLVTGVSRENEQDFGKRRLTISVDANTIVSGLLFDGNEALLLGPGETGLCTLVTTHYVIDEVT